MTQNSPLEFFICIQSKKYKVVLISEKAMAPHFSTLAWKIPWTEEPGRLQSIGSLPVGHTERLHFHFSLSHIGEGNGNPLQCSCLENPRDGVAQSRTRLKWLSSSSSSSPYLRTSKGLQRFPWLLRSKESACIAGNIRDLGSLPRWERSPVEGNGYPHQYSCRKIPWTG